MRKCLQCPSLRQSGGTGNERLIEKEAMMMNLTRVNASYEVGEHVS